MADRAEPTDTGRCGESAGYDRHRKRGEHPCRACKDAKCARQKRYRRRKPPRYPHVPAKPLPPYAHPYAGQDVMHDFRPMSPAQCVDCFGWRDDPRHR